MGFGNVNKKLLGCNQIRNFLVQATLFQDLNRVLFSPLFKCHCYRYCHCYCYSEMAK